MKLRTSFFNARALGKDITRFSPAWALYSVVLALTFLIINDSTHYMAQNMVDAYMALAWFNFIYAPICALLLFGDLLSSRMCNALHALPMRREGWFLTHCTAGFLFALVPNGLFSLICSLFIAPHGAVAGMFFAIAMLQFLFFFGAAVLSVFCVGNRFAAVVVYAIINFLPMLIYVLLYNHYVPLLYGLTIDAETFLRMCPIYTLTTPYYIDFYPMQRFSTKGITHVYYEQWQYLFIAAGVGLVFLVIAVLLYRRRKLESAGDFVAFKPLGPVFLVLYTAAVGTFLYTFGNELLNDYEYLLLAIGLLVGYFTGRMLLDRTVKVFHKRSLFGFVTITAVLALTMFVTWLDPMGVVTKVPQLQEVKSVTVSTTTMNNDFHYLSDFAPWTTDENTIQTIIDVHQYLAQTQNEDDGSVTVDIVYTLENGTTLHRQYPVDIRSKQAQSLKEIFSSWQYIFRNQDWENVKDRVVEVFLDDGDHHKGSLILSQVLDALYQDCQAGVMAQDWIYHQNDNFAYSLPITIQLTEDYRNIINLIIFDSCSNTAKLLDEYYRSVGYRN